MSLKKIFFVLLTMLVTVFSLAIISSAEETRVYDMDSMLTEKDIEQINAAAAKAEEKYGCRFYTVTYSADGRFEKYIGEDFIADRGLSYSDDIVLLIITFDTVEREYYYNMYLYGKADRRMSNGEIDSVLDSDSVMRNLKSGRLAEGAVAFIELSGEAVKMPWGILLIVSAVAAAVVGGLTAFIVTAKYKMRMNPTNYPLDRYAKLELKGSEDTFKDKHISVIVTSSDGGGGRSGGGGGGYGGGRGHAGGR